MVDKLAKKSLKSGLKLIIFQLLLVLAITLISTVLFSVKTGYSALAGGVTYVLPNAIFVYMSFAYAGAQKAKLVLRGFYGGEALKLVFTVILFSLFLGCVELSFLAFYGSFFCLLVSQWFAPFFFYRNNGMKNDS